MGVAADFAAFAFGQCAADATMTDAFHGLCHGPAQMTTTFTVALQEMKSHALGRLGAYAWQTAQALDQIFEQALILHLQNGI